LAGWKYQTDRHVWIPEIVHVAVVSEFDFPSLCFGQEPTDGRHPASAGLTRDKDIVPIVVNLKANVQGPESSFLADDLFGSLDIIRCCDIEMGWVALPSKHRGGKSIMMRGRSEFLRPGGFDSAFLHGSSSSSGEIIGIPETR